MIPNILFKTTHKPAKSWELHVSQEVRNMVPLPCFWKQCLVMHKQQPMSPTLFCGPLAKALRDTADGHTWVMVEGDCAPTKRSNSQLCINFLPFCAISTSLSRHVRIFELQNIRWNNKVFDSDISKWFENFPYFSTTPALIRLYRRLQLPLLCIALGPRYKNLWLQLRSHIACTGPTVNKKEKKNKVCEQCLSRSHSAWTSIIHYTCDLVWSCA